MGQKDLKAYKEDYESVHMSEDQVEQMKKRMQQAKQETQGKKIIEREKRKPHLKNRGDGSGSSPGICGFAKYIGKRGAGNGAGAGLGKSGERRYFPRLSV